MTDTSADLDVSLPDRIFSLHQPMTKLKIVDFSIHALLPLAAGILYYWLAATFYSVPGGGYIPDGLWAYALFSSILIVWDRKINITWLSFAALTSIFFEIMQYLRLIRGTGDIIDVVIYLIFGSIAIITNRFFSTGYNHSFSHKTTQSAK